MFWGNRKGNTSQHILLGQYNPGTQFAKNITRKENYTSIFLMNKNKKFLSKLLAN